MRQTAKRKSEYCDYDKYVYYDKNLKTCITCPKCRPGAGMKGMTYYRILVDPDNGALQCRYCVSCVKGYTFSDTTSYNDCQRCTVCGNGLTLSRNCTRARDTECVKLVVKETTAEPHVHLVTTDNGNPHFLHVVIGSLTFSTVFLLIVLIAVVCIAVWCYKNLRKLRKENIKLKDAAAMKLIKPPLSRQLFSAQDQYIETDMQGFTSDQQLRSFTARKAKKGETSTETDGVEYDYPDQEQYAYSIPMSTVHTNEDGDDDDDYEDVITVQEREKERENKLTDKQFRIAAKYLAGLNEHIKFASYLGVEDAEVNIIKTEHSSDIREQAYRILIKWQQIKAKDANLSSLYAALKEFQRPDIISELQKCA